MKLSRGLICVVGYNREECLLRLLDSLGKVKLDEHDIDLVVSLDHSPQQASIASEISSRNYINNPRVILRKQNLGLKKHIISCGDLVLDPDYDFIVVLEDDLLLSPAFISYLFPAIEASKKSGRQVSGISLYSYLYSEETLLPFEHQPDKFDGYFLKFPSSWGQVWTKDMWSGFKSWFSHNDCESFDDPLVPEFVRSWPVSSWKKHYLRYMIHSDSYFLYPNYSLTSNPGEDGTHHKNVGGTFSVPLLVEDRDWFLPRIQDAKVKYDYRFHLENRGRSMKSLSRYDIAKVRYLKAPIGVKAAFLLFIVSLSRKFFGRS